MDTNLQREDDHCEAHNCCDAHCHDHCVSVMEAGDHPHHVGHTESQDGLKTRNTNTSALLHMFEWSAVSWHGGYKTSLFLKK